MAEAVEALTGSTQPPQRDVEAERTTADRISVATQWQLMWWRFRKHRAGDGGRGRRDPVLHLSHICRFPCLFRPAALRRAVVAAWPPSRSTGWMKANLPPMSSDSPASATPRPLSVSMHQTPTTRSTCNLFAEGYEYKFLGVFPTNIHLIGVQTGIPEEALFLLGTDLQGRDLFSRLMIGTRTSLTIGLVGVALSLFLGVLLGGISGLYGGAVDTVIQRVIEVVRSIPTIPLWMALAAAMPSEWPITLQLLLYHTHNRPYRLDDHGARRARALSLAAPRRLRDRR